MAASSDRTTIKAALDALIDRFRTNLIADPPTVTKPLRLVEEGDGGVTLHARPFMAVGIARVRVIGVTDDDRIIEVTAGMRVVVDASGASSRDAILDVVGAVDDYLDSIRDSGVIDGADGFDDRTWTFAYPKPIAGARMITAEASQPFVVRVARGFNRAPAP